MRCAASLLALLLAPLAGCIGEPDLACAAGDACPAVSEADLVPPAAAPPQARWESCAGMIGAFELPLDQARPMVPAPFDPRGLTASTASFLFEALECERAVTGDHVATAAGYFHLLARVRPDDASWSDDQTPSFFTLLAIATDPDLAEALRALGMDAVPAHLDRPASPGAPLLQAWRYVAGDLGVEFEFAERGEAAGGGDARAHYWHASDGGFRRVENTKDYDTDALVLEAGVLRIDNHADPPGLPADFAVGWTGQAYHLDDEVWTGSADLYGSEERSED